MKTLELSHFRVNLPSEWKHETPAPQSFIWFKESDSLILKIQCNDSGEISSEELQAIILQWFGGITLSDGTTIKPTGEAIHIENGLFYEYRNGDEIVSLEDGYFIAYYGGMKSDPESGIMLTFFVLMVFHESEIPGLEKELGEFIQIVESITFNSKPKPPAVSPLQLQLQNKKLHFMESYNSGYGGGGYNTEEIIMLYAGNHFAYHYTHVTSAYNSGGFSLGGGYKEKKGKGRWEILSGGNVLTLYFQDGETKQYSLRTGNEVVWLNDRKFYIVRI